MPNHETELFTKEESAFFPEPFRGSFLGKDVISVEQFTSPSEIEYLFGLAEKMGSAVQGKERLNLLRDSTVAIIFYQPSTRTFTSFEAAAKWLGCQRVIAVPGMEAYSSAVKGESLADTIRSIERTTAADVIVLRHPEDNSSEIAAKYANVPVINAGSGRREHPTQAMLDLFTIKEELGTLNNLRIVMLGDLQNGRTIKSLAKLLTIVASEAEITFVSPPSLRAPVDLIARLRGLRGIKVEETENLDEVLPKADVLYVTRVQKEWFKDEKEYQRLKGSYVITPELMRKAKNEMIVMHPLPRVDEIHINTDIDPRAAYFRQMENGLYIRMGLLLAVLGKA